MEYAHNGITCIVCYQEAKTSSSVNAAWYKPSLYHCSVFERLLFRRNKVGKPPVNPSLPRQTVMLLSAKSRPYV